MVIAHYNPKGLCARGVPSTPCAIGYARWLFKRICTSEKRKLMAKTSINVRACNIDSAEQHKEPNTQL